MLLMKAQFPSLLLVVLSRGSIANGHQATFPTPLTGIGPRPIQGSKGGARCLPDWHEGWSIHRCKNVGFFFLSLPGEDQEKMYYYDL